MSTNKQIAIKLSGVVDPAFVAKEHIILFAQWVEQIIAMGMSWRITKQEGELADLIILEAEGKQVEAFYQVEGLHA